LNRTNGGLFSDLVQTSAAANGGNSGGPLLNEKGEVVAVITYVGRPQMALQEDGKTITGYVPLGMTYGRSAATASAYVQMLIKQGEIRRADLGFTVKFIPHIQQERANLPKYGVLVTGIRKDSAETRRLSEWRPSLLDQVVGWPHLRNPRCWLSQRRARLRQGRRDCHALLSSAYSSRV
jgi:S1-C subfamily serine protease